MGAIVLSLLRYHSCFVVNGWQSIKIFTAHEEIASSIILSLRRQQKSTYCS